jgi:drug/metabolite transporter (DMT)-like permease
VNPLISPIAALASAATFGVADFTGGLAGRRTPPPSVTVGIEVFGLAALPLALWLLPLGWDLQAAVLTFVGGALGGLGLIAFYRAMALDLIGVVAPVAGVVGAALPTVVGLLTGDRLQVWQFGGIGVGLFAIFLMNAGTDVTSGKGRQGLGLAVVAGLSFGLFFILFHAASSAGITAFISGRVGSSVAAVGFALATGVSFVAQRSAWRLIVVAGVLDGAGVTFYLFATHHGALSVTALLASFYPAFTVLCARLLTRERLAPIQAVGALMALIAIALIAIP